MKLMYTFRPRSLLLKPRFSLRVFCVKHKVFNSFVSLLPSPFRSIFINKIFHFQLWPNILGGYFASSLAVMTDASHLLTDVSSFLISLLALRMAAKPKSKKLTFGWHRAGRHYIKNYWY